MRAHVHHLIAGAREDLRLVRDDVDRYDLIERMAEALGGLVLGYCVMDTHLHVVAEGEAEHTCRWLEAALVAYTRAFNARHGLDGKLLRGPIEALRRAAPYEVVRSIGYVHRNPLTAQPPLVVRDRHYPWSSRRAFAGLTLARVANVERALELAGEPLARRLVGSPASLADLEPTAMPTASLESLVAAAADVYLVRPWDVAGVSREPRVRAARALLVRLGRLEALNLTQIGSGLGRSAAQTCRLGQEPLADEDRALRVARTLLRDPETRRFLRRQAPACRDPRRRPRDPPDSRSPAGA